MSTNGHELFEPKNIDPFTTVFGLALLLQITLIRGLAPGRRAALVGPVTALREE